MPRFFISDQCLPTAENGDLTERVIVIEGEDAAHIGFSLRMKPGEKLCVCTYSGIELDCVIENIRSESGECTVHARILSVSTGSCESPVYIHVYQAFCKGDKMEEVVQKSIELGASEITPVYSDRIVSRPDKQTALKKCARWQRIADEAAKQSQRAKLPKVNAPIDFSAALENIAAADCGFICYEGEKEQSLKSIIKKREIQTLSFFIGPEGGLSDNEVSLAAGREIACVTLGKRILRAQTAAPAVLAMLLYEFEL